MPVAKKRVDRIRIYRQFVSKETPIEINEIFGRRNLPSIMGSDDFFDKIKANTPRILNVNLMMAHSPGSVRELIRLGNRLLNRASLDPLFRELAIIRVSRLCGSPYEMAQHIPIAFQTGISREQIENIETWQDSEIFSEEEKVVLAFTEEVVHDSEPSEKTFAEASTFLDATSLVE